MEDFPNAYVYCQQLKELFDQLKNVGAPVSNNCLVLQMVVDLTKAYNGATVNLVCFDDAKKESNKAASKDKHCFEINTRLL